MVLPPKTLRLHVRRLSDPANFTIDQMVANACSVYETAGVLVDVVSAEDLTLPDLETLEIGECVSTMITLEQRALFSQRNAAVPPTDVFVFFVRETVLAALGCGAHDVMDPACAVVAACASSWTLAHELGHLLGLGHCDDVHRLMHDGTWSLVDPVGFNADEITHLRQSNLLV